MIVFYGEGVQLTAGATTKTQQPVTAGTSGEFQNITRATQVEITQAIANGTSVNGQTPTKEQQNVAKKLLEQGKVMTDQQFSAAFNKFIKDYNLENYFDNWLKQQSFPGVKAEQNPDGTVSVLQSKYMADYTGPTAQANEETKYNTELKEAYAAAAFPLSLKGESPQLTDEDLKELGKKGMIERGGYVISVEQEVPKAKPSVKIEKKQDVK